MQGSSHYIKKNKKFSFLILLSPQLCNAQTYKQNKLNYNKANYQKELTDSYESALCGIASFFIPGLGQIIAGETGRGFAFLGISILSTTVMTSGIIYLNKSVYEHQYSTEFSPKGVVFIAVGLFSMATISIWSAIDAVGVAKVNNMYLRDVRNKVSFQVAPYLDTITYQNTGSLPIGVSLNLTF